CGPRRDERRRRADRNAATRRRDRGAGAHTRHARLAHPHRAGQPAARGCRGSPGGDPDGDPPRPHAGARLGRVGGGRRHCRCLDRDLLVHRADGRRIARADRVRGRRIGRLRQRARRAPRGADHRRDPVAVRLLVRSGLQGRHRLCAVRRDPVDPAARPDGEALMRWLGPAAAVVLILYPLLFTGPFYERMGADLLLAAIAASAWNIVGGYAGQISVGHAMFFGAGAYAPLLVYTHWQFPPLAGVPLGIAVSLAMAVVIGMPSFRLRGHYFSMATIAAAELVRIVVGNWDFVGAAIGLMGPPVARTVFDLSFRSAVPYYYLFLVVLIALLGTTWLLERGRMGYYWRAIQAGERAARSLGVPARRYKLYALMLSAAFTSVAGSLYALMVGFVDPESGFGILVSVDMVITAALGGVGTLFGPLIGAVILVPLKTATNSAFGGGGSGLTYILYGGIILLLARFEPGGLLELWDRLTARRSPPIEARRAA